MFLREIIFTILLSTIVKSANTNSISKSTSDSLNTGEAEPERIVLVKAKNATKIHFSEKDSNTNHLSETKDQNPLTNYEKCKENEWFYPGDVDGDWV